MMMEVEIKRLTLKHQDKPPLLLKRDLLSSPYSNGETTNHWCDLSDLATSCEEVEDFFEEARQYGAEYYHDLNRMIKNQAADVQHHLQTCPACRNRRLILEQELAEVQPYEDLAQVISLHQANLAVLSNQTSYRLDLDTTQANLGVGLLNQFLRHCSSSSDLLGIAIKSLRVAVRENALPRPPFERATIYSDLGCALRLDFEQSASETSLEKAFEAFETALTSLKFPTDDKSWEAAIRKQPDSVLVADILNNLGNTWLSAYETQPVELRSRFKGFSRAVSCFKAALIAFAHDEFALNRAIVSYNLGNAWLQAYQDHPHENTFFREALYCLKSADEFFQVNDYLLNYRTVQKALAQTMRYRYAQSGEPADLAQAEEYEQKSAASVHPLLPVGQPEPTDRQLTLLETEQDWSQILGKPTRYQLGSLQLGEVARAVAEFSWLDKPQAAHCESEAVVTDHQAEGNLNLQPVLLHSTHNRVRVILPTVPASDDQLEPEHDEWSSDWYHLEVLAPVNIRLPVYHLAACRTIQWQFDDRYPPISPRSVSTHLVWQGLLRWFNLQRKGFVLNSPATTRPVLSATTAVIRHDHLRARHTGTLTLAPDANLAVTAFSFEMLSQRTYLGVNLYQTSESEVELELNLVNLDSADPVENKRIVQILAQSEQPVLQECLTTTQQARSLILNVPENEELWNALEFRLSQL